MTFDLKLYEFLKYLIEFLPKTLAVFILSGLKAQ